MDFKENTMSWYANEIGKIQGKLEFADNWARVNGGFDPIAPAHRAKMQDQIEKLGVDMQKLRLNRGRA